MKLSNRGYTLLEVIVVVLILSLLTVVSIPNFMGWLHQYRLQAATASLTNHLRAARLLAIFKGVEHQVQLKKFDEGNYYQVVEDPGGRDRIVSSIGRVVLHKQFGEILIKEIPTSETISFYPKGTSSNKTILLENAVNAQVEIVTNNFGRVKSRYL